MVGSFWNRVYYRTKKITSIEMQGRYANVNIHWQFTRNNSWWGRDPAHFDPSALSSRPGCNCNSLMLLSLALLFHYSTLHNWVKYFLKPNSNNCTQQLRLVWFGTEIGRQDFFNTKFPLSVLVLHLLQLELKKYLKNDENSSSKTYIEQIKTKSDHLSLTMPR